MVYLSEAILAFRDPLGRIFADESHSVDEVREILVGHSSAKRLLVVCFTQRTADRVRIISVRNATKKERRDYEEYTSG